MLWCRNCRLKYTDCWQVLKDALLRCLCWSASISAVRIGIYSIHSVYCNMVMFWPLFVVLCLNLVWFYDHLHFSAKKYWLFLNRLVVFCLLIVWIQPKFITQNRNCLVRLCTYLWCDVVINFKAESDASGAPGLILWGFRGPLKRFGCDWQSSGPQWSSCAVFKTSEEMNKTYCFNISLKSIKSKILWAQHSWYCFPESSFAVHRFFC